MSGSGADVAANLLFTTLMADVGIADIPDVDFTGVNFQLPDSSALLVPVTKLTNADLTSGTANGTGTFDVLMDGFNATLKIEFDKGRITGEQYAKAFIELTGGAMSQAVQYLLGRDQAYWQAITAQQQALAAQVAVITARVALEAAKVQFATLRIEALKNEAEYALTKLKLATEDKTYGAAKFTLDTILPLQEKLLQEQVETARAGTMDTRTDGLTAVVGSIGKQKALYTQQITSYQRDSEVKAAKIFIDAWTVMKTIDEGLLPPTGFANVTLDAILTKLKTVNDLI